MAEQIAIVGMACRFPGAASAQDFWDLLATGRHGIGRVPADRWDADAYYSADAAAPGKANTRSGGFINGVDLFDAPFFGIARREATQMDPQQRLLLELSYEALEDAGFAPGDLAGSDTSVFVGVMSNEYAQHQSGNDLRDIDVHTGGGAGYCMTANRLSYHFDFHGPSMALDSACSSSLVAVFHGCQSLWTGQSRVALAAGCNLILSPAFNIFYTKGGLSAPDGTCKTFSAAANGIGRGEGVGVVILKRLSDALADGDRIYAVISGGAVNHGGRSNGVTAPNRWAQEQLLRKALQHAGTRASDLQYVELHGTGTLIGDPIEANALGAVLQEDTARSGPCLAGSVKGNIGHLEGAAGIAGLIKLVLSIANRQIPPSLWFNDPNPHIPFDRLPLRINTELTAWPTVEGRCVAGISSFGLGGTNAHLILESAPERHATPRLTTPERAVPATHWLLLSARSEAALNAMSDRYAAYLAGQPETALPAICHSAIQRKGMHEYRLSLLGSNRDALIEGLRAFTAGRKHPDQWSGRYRQAPRRPCMVVMPDEHRLDPGRVATWLQQAPASRAAWEAVRAACRAQGQDVLPTLNQLVSPESQPQLDSADSLLGFATQYAMLMHLVALLPTLEGIVAGRACQLAAYCAAGGISLGDAVALLRQGGITPGTTAALPPNQLRIPCETTAGRDKPASALEWNPAPAALTALFDTVWQRPGTGGVWLTLTGDHAAPAADPDRWIATLDNQPDSYWRMVAALSVHRRFDPAALYDHTVDFAPLPAYPWQRERYWLSRPKAAAEQLTEAATRTAADASPIVASAIIRQSQPAGERSVRADILAAPPALRQAALIAYLSTRVADALHLAVSQLDPDAPLNSIGIDSLTATEIKNRIERDFGLTISVVRFLEDSSIVDFANLIRLDLEQSPDVRPATPNASTPNASTPIQVSLSGIDPVIARQVQSLSGGQLDDMLRQLMVQGQSR